MITNKIIVDADGVYFYSSAAWLTGLIRKLTGLKDGSNEIRHFSQEVLHVLTF